TPRSVREGHAIAARPGEEGFTSRFEQVLHDVVLSGTEATNSDVGMSRGPRKISALSNAISQDRLEPLDWEPTRSTAASHPAAISCGDSPKPRQNSPKHFGRSARGCATTGGTTCCTARACTTGQLSGTGSSRPPCRM